MRALTAARLAHASADALAPVLAAAAGLQAIFIRRGPWAWIQSPVDDPPEAALTVNSLAEIPARIGRLAGT